MPEATQKKSQSTSAMVWLIAVLPTFDCIINQVNTAFGIEIGPVSLLQASRSCVLVVLLAALLRRTIENNARFTGFHICGAAGLAVIAMALSKEMIVTDHISVVSIGSYGQLSYWIILCMVAASVANRQRDARIMLYGLAIGALTTALSVFLGYFAGGFNPYADENVTASAGWFNTAKTITGVLLTGAVVILFLGRHTKGWISTALAGLCFIACIMTYARAGVASLLFILGWFSIWWILFGRGQRGVWVSKLLLVTILAGVGLPLLLNSESWKARWEDMQDGDKAGSGRAMFWRVAVNGYLSGNSAEHVFGRGYADMAEMLFHDYGDDIKHTHNDFLDMALVGGVVGLAWLVLLLSFLFIKTLSVSLSSYEGAAALAVLLIYLCHGQFTGQLFGTDSMAYYTIALVCLFRIAERRAPEVQSEINHALDLRTAVASC